MDRTSPDFQQCVEWLRSKDALTFEDGYHALLPRVHEFRDDLIRLLQVEPEAKIRARFIELLGETEDSSLVDVLAAQLHAGEPEVIQWALTALERIGHKSLADEYRREHPEYD